MNKLDLLDRGTPTEYIVKDIVGDYGVYAQYQHPDSHLELLIICNSRSNAMLIRDIMECDDNNQVYTYVHDTDSKLDISNGNILDYLAENYKTKGIRFSTDGGYDYFELDLNGIGRISKLNKGEINDIRGMMIADKVIITRTILGITLWRLEL